MLLETRIPLRYLAKKVGGSALIVVALATALEYATLVVEGGADFFPVIPTALPAFLGTAISLLLSFKLNQSYERWWEARRIWGAIVNDSRSLVRQLLSFAKGDRERVRQMTHRQIAWCFALGQSLRGLDWRTNAEGHLSPRECIDLDAHTNKALGLLQRQAQDLTRLADDGHLSDYQRIAVDGTLTRLTDSMGQAERIRNTVFPKTYRLFLHAFMYLFIVILAIALTEIEGLWQVLITTLVSTPLLALEKTARHMQDPFANRPTDTAVTAIARTIEIDLLQLIEEPEIPPPWGAEGFYLL